MVRAVSRFVFLLAAAMRFSLPRFCLGHTTGYIALVVDAGFQSAHISSEVDIIGCRRFCLRRIQRVPLNALAAVILLSCFPEFLLLRFDFTA